MSVRDFSFQLMRMQTLFHKRLLKDLEATGLSNGQPKVLAFLKSHEGRSQKKIAQACQLEPSSVTVLLKRMEQQGIIERRLREGDQKTRCVFLTGRGRELAACAVESFFRTEERALSGFREEEKAQRKDYCRRIVDNLQSE